MIETTEKTISTPRGEDLAGILIRDLVAAHPETMAVLAPLGIDLCCGGGHPLGKAVALHGFDRDTVLAQVAEVIQSSSDERR